MRLTGTATPEEAHKGRSHSRVFISFLSTVPFRAGTVRELSDRTRLNELNGRRVL